MKKDRKKPAKQSLFPDGNSLGGPGPGGQRASQTSLGGNPFGAGKSAAKPTYDPTTLNPKNQPASKPQRGASNTPPTRMRKTGP